MEMVKVEGGGTVFLSEGFCDDNVLEFVVEFGPFVIESDHVFDAFLMLLLERCGGGGLGGGVWCRCTFRTGYLWCRLSG